MSQTITFDHSEGGYDFVSADALDGRDSLGEREAALPIALGQGPSHTVHKVAASHLVRTVAEFPDDYDDHPQAVVHYIQTLTDSHAPKIDKVYGPDALARKFAVMLGAEYGGADAPADQAPQASAADAFVAAPAITTEVQA